MFEKGFVGTCECIGDHFRTQHRFGFMLYVNLFFFQKYYVPFLGFSEVLLDNNCLNFEQLATLKTMRDNIFENIPNYSLYESFSIYINITPEIALQRIHERARPQETDRISLEYLRKLDQKHKQWFANNVVPVRGRGGKHVESKYGGFVMNSESIELTVERLVQFILHFCMDPVLANLDPHFALTCKNNFAFANTCEDCKNTSAIAFFE